jgi:DNA-binding transcriptional LysR family regulator
MGYLGEQTITERFGMVCPDAEVLVRDELPDLELEQHLLGGDYDFALLTNPVNPDLMAVPLVNDYQFFWVNRANRLAGLDQIRTADLNGQTVMTVGDGFRSSGRFAQLCDEANVSVNVRFSCEMIRVYEAARAGRALGLTCRNHVEATSDSTKTVGIPYKDLPWGFSLCYRRDLELDDVRLAFLDYMRTLRRAYD